MNQELTKKKIDDLIVSSHDQISVFLTTLDDRQMTENTNESGWSVKDYIIHLATWQTGMTHLLSNRNRWEGMGVPRDLGEEKDTDRINQYIYQNHKAMTIEEALKMLEASNKGMIDVLESLSIEELMMPYNHYDGDSKVTGPVIQWVNGNTHGHFDEHLPKLKKIAGE